MQVMIEIPDDVAQELTARNGAVLPRAILEMVALEGHRSKKLTHFEVMRLLGFEHRIQVDTFLTEHQVPLHLDREEMEEELKTLASLEQG